MTRTLVHVKVLNGTNKEMNEVSQHLKNMKIDGYQFLVTNDRIEVTTLANEIIKNATSLADKILKERSQQ